jgi:hypothetical protein
MANRPVLLPQPQELVWGDGLLDLHAGLTLRVDERAWAPLQAALAALAEDVAAVGGRLATTPVAAPAGAPLAVGTAAPHPDSGADLPEGEEGYSLTVGLAGVQLVARSAHGLFNGLQTLRQLVAQSGGTIPAVAIRDWPALAIRGIHLDMKGAMAPVSYWQEAIRLMAHYKLNAALIEYEDKFPYASHPEVVGPGALTREDLAALLATAREQFVDVIPLLQTLGHAEYILRHPQHAHLRESGSLTQFCPQHEGSWPLLGDLLEEMIAAHPDAKDFHLGADEAWLLGDCPRCRAFVEREGKLALYLGFVNRSIERVQAAGMRPIIWDDMIQRNLSSGGLDLLPEGVMLCNWAYGQRDVRSPIFFYGGTEGHSRFRWASRQWLDRDPGMLDPFALQWIEDAPADVEAFAREYWDRGEYPLYGASFPWIRYFREHGRAVVGASAAKGANGFHIFSPMYDHRMDNCAAWAQAAREDGAEGVLATAWSRYDGLRVPCEPFELGWQPYLATAAWCWEARNPQRAALDEQFRAAFLAIDDPLVTRAVEWLDRGKRTGSAMLLRRAAEVFAAAESPTPHGRRYLAHLALAARLAGIALGADRLLDDGWAQFPRAAAGTISAEHRERIIEGARQLLAELAAWQGDARRVLPEGLGPEDLEEVIVTQTAGYIRRLGDLLAEMERATPLGGGEA